MAALLRGGDMGSWPHSGAEGSEGAGGALGPGSQEDLTQLFGVTGEPLTIQHSVAWAAWAAQRPRQQGAAPVRSAFSVSKCVLWVSSLLPGGSPNSGGYRPPRGLQLALLLQAGVQACLRALHTQVDLSAGASSGLAPTAFEVWMRRGISAACRKGPPLVAVHEFSGCGSRLVARVP